MREVGIKHFFSFRKNYGHSRKIFPFYLNRYLSHFRLRAMHVRVNDITKLDAQIGSAAILYHRKNLFSKWIEIERVGKARATSIKHFIFSVLGRPDVMRKCRYCSNAASHEIINDYPLKFIIKYMGKCIGPTDWCGDYKLHASIAWKRSHKRLGKCI